MGPYFEHYNGALKFEVRTLHCDALAWQRGRLVSNWLYLQIVSFSVPSPLHSHITGARAQRRRLMKCCKEIRKLGLQDCSR